jgi:adenylate cyclase
MPLIRWIAASGFRVTMLIAISVFIYHVANELRVLFGRPLNFHQRLELTALDVKFAFRGKKPPDKWHTAVAAFDEKAIQEFGPPPWSRMLHARLADKLTALGAKSIAFDITFDHASSLGGDDRARDIAARAEELGVFKQAGVLEKSASSIDRVASELNKLQKPKGVHGEVKPFLEPLKSASKEARTVKPWIEWLEKELKSGPPKAVNADQVFGDSLKKSNRAVLGVISLSKQEAESMGAKSEELSRSLVLVASSTISELVSKGDDGLDYVAPHSKDAFENGLYERFFGVEAPYELLARATPYYGTINVIPDDDGVYRSVPLVSGIKGSGVLLPTLALKAVEVARSPDVIQVIGHEDDPSPQAIQIGSLRVDTQLEAATILDWYGHFTPEDMPIFSVSDVLADRTKPEDIQDRVVFIAATAAGTHDQRVTPLERAVPGVYIHATLAQNILDGRHLLRPRHVIAIELAMFVLVGLVAGFFMTRLGVIGQVLTGLSMAAGWLLLDQFVFFANGLVVYTVLPVFQIFLTLLAVALWRFLIEARERKKTKEAFGQYLAPKVMEQVLSHPEQYLKLGGKRYEATVLFSDIRGFTTMSEALSPEELGMLLNRYMTPMTKIVFEFDGTLDKYIGDAVMAFWGAPLEQMQHAVLGCRAALKMIQKVEELNIEFEQANLPRIAIGIGLSSGPMTIGNMGSDDHFAYTALGDRVNLGARLEGQTKDYGVDIIISDACYQLVKHEMACRELGALRVKGKYEPVRIYQLIGELKNAEAKMPFVSTFHQGLDAYRRQAWDEAIEHFTRARALSGLHGDKTSDHYIGWCMEYKESPPPAGWDGVRIATTK